MNTPNIEILIFKTFSYFGLKQPFSKKELLDRYKKIARKLHPDKNGNKELFTDMCEVKDKILHLFSLYGCDAVKPIYVFNEKLSSNEQNKIIQPYQKLCILKAVLKKYYNIQQPFSSDDFVRAHGKITSLRTEEELRVLNDYFQEVLSLFEKLNIPSDEKVTIFEPYFVLKKIYGNYYGTMMWYFINFVSCALSIPGIIMIGALVYYFYRYT